MKLTTGYKKFPPDADTHVLLAGGGSKPLSDFFMTYGGTDTVYLPEGNVSIRDATSSDYTSCTVTASDLLYGGYRNIQLSINTAPAAGTIIKVTTSSILIDTDTSKRAVFYFSNSSIISIMDESSSATGDKWFYLYNNPLYPNRTYYFKFRGSGANFKAYYLGTNLKFISSTGSGGGATTLNGLTDVTITNPSNGLVLKYNGTSWVNGTDNTSSGGGASTLNGLNDVTLSNFLVRGLILKYDGTKWVNGSMDTGSTNPVNWYTLVGQISCTHNSVAQTLAFTSVSGGAYLLTVPSYYSATLSFKLSAINSTGNGTDIHFSGNEFNDLSTLGVNIRNSKIYLSIGTSAGSDGINITTNDLITLTISPTTIVVKKNGSIIFTGSNESSINRYLFILPRMDLTFNQFSLNGFNNSYPTLDSTQHSSNLSYVILGSNYSGSPAKFLREDGTWQNISSGSSSLNGLTDVTISSPTNGLVLKYNGIRWVNGTDNTGSGGASQATSWAESGTGTLGISSPTLSVNKAAFASSGASVDNLPDALYFPGEDTYYALPVVIDDEGKLFVAISPTLARFVQDDKWKSISPKE